MLAYSTTTLENLAIHEAAEEAADFNLISPQKETEIKSHYVVDVYSPNIFVRIGLGLLTVFIVLASVGLVGLMTSFSAPVFLMLVFAAGCFALLSYITGTRKHFSSGVDHVLMFSVIFFITAALIEMLPPGFNEDLLASVLVCLISLGFFLRFADSIMAIVSFVAMAAFIVNFAKYFGTSSKLILPFIMMVFAAGVYVVCRRMKGDRKDVYYSKGLRMLELLSVLTFYVAGNYFVVNQLLNQIIAGRGTAILPQLFQYFLWAFTLVVPFVYLATGIKFKDLMLCRLGILCIALTILTYRYYYSILSPEAAMLLAGLLICITAYLLSRFLKQPKAGFIFKNLNRRKKDSANLEGVIIAETFGHRQTSSQPDTTFGGGSFGGAGAGDRY